MKRTVRFDRSLFNNKKIKKHDNGFLTVPAFVTRTGIFKYITKDGTIIKELRPATEVFDKTSLDTLKNIPVTNDHPIERVVDITNAKKNQVGMTSDKVEIVDDQFIESVLTITDGDTIVDVETGKNEISCGYTADLDFTPGIYQGEKYDAIQKNICYNHVAIVDSGRAGEKVRLHLDNDYAIMILDDDNDKKPKGDNNMKKIKIDGKEFEVKEDLAEAIENENKAAETKVEETKKEGEKKVKEEVEKKDAEIKALKEKLDNAGDKDKLQAKIDTLEEEKKKLQEKVDNFPKEINDKAKSRLELLDVASKALDEETLKKVDSMSDKEIKKAIIKHKAGVENIDSKSDSYIDARFDMIVEGLGKENNDSKEDLGKILLDGKEVKADEVKNASMKRRSEAWQTGPDNKKK